MVKWLARLVSLVVMADFGVLLAAVATNEDPVEPAGMPVVILMAVAVALCAASWWWGRAGGVLLVAMAVALAAATLSSTAAFGLGAEGIVVVAIYSLPVLVAGGLFLMSGGPGGPKQTGCTLRRAGRLNRFLRERRRGAAGARGGKQIRNAGREAWQMW